MSGPLPMWGNPEYMGVLVDEVWLPLHIHKDKLMDGTWKDKDVVVYNPVECRIPDTIGERGLTIPYFSYNDLDVKSFKEYNASINSTIPNIADNISIEGWPWHWAWMTAMISARQMNGKPDWIEPPTGDFTCLNNKIKPHRDLMWNLLSGCGLLNDSCTYVYRGITVDVVGDAIPDLGEIMIPEFYRYSLIDLINESDVEQIFFTEKTWRAVLMGKIPLVFAAPNFYQAFQQLGFQLHDEIDYSFDHITDDGFRADRIVDQLINLKEYDIIDLHHSTLDVRENNFNRLMDVFMQERLPDWMLGDITPFKYMKENRKEFADMAKGWKDQHRDR